MTWKKGFGYSRLLHCVLVKRPCFVFPKVQKANPTASTKRVKCYYNTNRRAKWFLFNSGYEFWSFWWLTIFCLPPFVKILVTSTQSRIMTHALQMISRPLLVSLLRQYFWGAMVLSYFLTLSSWRGRDDQLAALLNHLSLEEIILLFTLSICFLFNRAHSDSRYRI